MNAPFDITRLLSAWQLCHDTLHLGPIRDDAHYDRVHACLHWLLDQQTHTTDCKQKQATQDLIDIMADLLEHYDTHHVQMPAGKPRDVLAFLMQQHGLKQKDLPEIGSQGVVSEILAGHRELNLRQVRALAKRFGVSAKTFL